MTGTTNTATPTCNGYLSYSQVGDPRNFMPTERLRFQSNYFKNFETSGSIGYSTSDYHFSDLSEIVNDWTARSGSRGSTAGGPIKTKRVSVNADWSGAYAVTDKFRIVDMFRYDNWRIPGVWDTAETNVFGTPSPGPGVVGLLLSPGAFSATNCPVAPYNQATCPQHASSSAADLTNEIASQFLAQNIKSNTLEFEYDFNRRFTAHIGYLYTNRTIASMDAAFDTGEYYFPGGATGTAANFYLAARGDCAAVGGALPAGCTLVTTGPLAGAIVEGSPSNPIPEAGNDTSRNITTINENALLLGAVAAAHGYLAHYRGPRVWLQRPIVSRALTRAKCSLTKSTQTTSRSRGPISTVQSRSTKTATTSRRWTTWSTTARTVSAAMFMGNRHACRWISVTTTGTCTPSR